MKRILVSLCCLWLVACGGGSPASPTPIAPAPQALQITLSGGLVTTAAGVLEGVLVLDGQDLAASRKTCPFSGGCVSLDLSALNLTITPGQHTFGVRLVRHTASGRVSYTTVGIGLVTRGGLPVQNITFGERNMNMGPNDMVSYQFTVQGS